VPQLTFAIEGGEPVSWSVAPALALKLRIRNAQSEEPISGVMLHVQIQIEATRRPYKSAELPKLLDLFGEPERWGSTLRAMLWTHASVNVPAFSGSVSVDLNVPCSFDFNVAATKYFHALEDGEVPLILLFSGTLFYEDTKRGLQAAQIPWESEARYRLPVETWRRLIDRYYPNTSWLTLRRDVFDRLYEFRSRNAIPTFEQAIERLLGAESPQLLSQKGASQ
jgi:hypothetical protein